MLQNYCEMNKFYSRNIATDDVSAIDKIKNILVIWMSIGLFVQLTCNFWLSSGSSQAAQINLWLMLPTLIILSMQVKKIRRLLCTKEELFVLAFIIWYALSANWSDSDKAGVAFDYIRNAAYILTYLSAIVIIHQYKRPFLLKSIDLATVVIAIGALVTLYTQLYLSDAPISFRGTRITEMGIAGLGSFSTSIQSGNFFGAFTVLAFARFLCIEEKPKAFLFLFITAIFATYVFFTGTRGAMAGVVFGFLACTATLHPRWLKHLLLLSIPAIALLIYFTTNIASIPLSSETIDQLLASATSNRWFAWERAITALLEQPFIGFGANAKMDIYNPLINFTYYHPHNGFVLIAYETGLIGLSLFIISMGSIIIHCFNNLENPELRLALALMAFSFIAMVTDVHVIVTRPHIYYLFLWLPVGIILGSVRQSYNQEKTLSLLEKNNKSA